MARKKRRPDAPEEAILRKRTAATFGHLGEVDPEHVRHLKRWAKLAVLGEPRRADG